MIYLGGMKCEFLKKLYVWVQGKCMLYWHVDIAVMDVCKGNILELLCKL